MALPIAVALQCRFISLQITIADGPREAVGCIFVTAGSARGAMEPWPEEEQIEPLPNQLLNSLDRTTEGSKEFVNVCGMGGIQQFSRQRCRYRRRHHHYQRVKR